MKAKLLKKIRNNIYIQRKGRTFRLVFNGALFYNAVDSKYFETKKDAYKNANNFILEIAYFIYKPKKIKLWKQKNK